MQTRTLDFRTFLLSLVVLASAVSTARVGVAGTWLGIMPDGTLRADAAATGQAPIVTVPWFDDTGLDVTVSLTGLEVARESLPAGEFVRVDWPGAATAGETGAPALPVVRRLFAAPLGAAVQVAVRPGSATAVDLQALGGGHRLLPAQGQLSGNSTEAGSAVSVDAHSAFTAPPPFRFDEQAYGVDAWTPVPQVTIAKGGILRGTQLYTLEVHPVMCNPARGALAVTAWMEIELRFQGGSGSPGGLRTPSPVDQLLLNPPLPAAPRDGSAFRMLLVTAPAFAGSAPLNQFVAGRTAHSIDVSTYVVPVGTNKTAIKAYIQSLWGTPDEPTYILIVGDALGLGEVSGSSSIPVCAIQAGILTIPTDVPYACMDGPDDWFPDIAISRFPAQSVGDLQSMVDKTLYVENGQYQDPTYAKRAVFIAGTDQDAGAEALHNYVIDAYMTPAGIQSNKVYAQTYGADTQDVTDAFNHGAFLGAYYGHAAGMQTWGSPLFTFADIEALTNAHLYPFLVSFSCSATAFYYTEPTQSPGFIEKWMLVPNKGAAAGYGCGWSQDPYTWDTWAAQYKFLFQSLYQDRVRELGPACLTTTAHVMEYYGADAPISRDYANRFYMLGDPSMKLPDPPPQNYLIVAPTGYVGSAPLNKLATAKQAQGFKVGVYAVPVGTTNTTIRNYIKSLWGTSNAPDFILIAGDSSGSSSTATTIPHWTGGGSKQAATDLPYACMGTGDDWYPEIAIGRLAVTSVAMLQTVVDKSLFVEAGTFSNPNYVKRVAFLANPDTYNTAEPTDEWVISTYLTPRHYEPVRIYAAQGGDTADVTAAVNTGCIMVTYMGHSGTNGWWDPAFDQTNVNALMNTGLYPLVFGWSCSTNHFEMDTECFGETWQRAAGKGAAAYISASNYIYWGSAEAWEPSGVLEKAFFTSFFQRNIWRVGPAWQSALYQFLDEYGQPSTPGGPPTQNADIVRNFFEEFVLLGDPALLIPQPNGFRISAAPAAQSVCAPPMTATTYALNIEQLGHFSGPVTLGATGVPAGTTVSFSTNGVAPPFSSVMTIETLDAAPVGTYTLTITGTSGIKLETASVQLQVSKQLPGTTALVSPANGALNVARAPTLTWQPATQAAEYLVAVSANPNFTQIVYQATVSETSTTVDTYLEGAHTYYWHVAARNGCGDGAASGTFSFTTISQRDYFTQSFQGVGGFDLANRTLYFTPDGSASFYHACSTAATQLPTDPNGSTNLTLTDDGYQPISIGTNRVKLYGLQYGTFWINANGHLTFNAGDGNWQPTLESHFDQPRISALLDDLTPPGGGGVSWKLLTNRVVVTYQNMQEWQAGGSSTFQIELFFNGEIHITWLGVTCTHPIVGLSEGNGLPPDYFPSDMSAYGPCTPPGACCNGTTCEVMYQSDCVAAGGVFKGEGTGCTPNPCVEYESSCLIISEVVRGAESGHCPRWIELTNTGTTEFAFSQGGLIVQTDDSNDIVVDVDLTGVVIPAGRSFVINSNAGGTCTGAFQGIYSRPADFTTNVTFGYGNERFILTDRGDGSRPLDIYGQFGVNGTGQPWEFTDGYSYRRSPWNAGEGRMFSPSEWFFGGVGSLAGSDPTGLLLTLTTPGTHVFDSPCTARRGDMNCDGLVNFADINPFVLALTGRAAYETSFPSCHWMSADCNHDGVVDFADINPFVALLTGQ